MNENRSRYALLILFTAIFLVSCFFLIENNLGHWGGDSAKYVLIARTLATGEGSNFINALGGKVLYFYHITVPLVLVPIVKIWGGNYIYMRWVFATMAVLSIWLIYFFIAREDKDSGLKSALLFGVSPMFLYYATFILSEVPYLFFSILCLLLAEKFLDERQILTVREIIFFFCSIILTLTRYIGISVIIAVFLYLIFTRKNLRKALFFLMFYLCLLYIWMQLLSTLGEYHNIFKGLLLKDPYDISKGTIGFFDLFFRWAKNFKFYLFNLSYPVLPYLRKGYILNIMFNLAIISGFVLWVRKKGLSVKEYYFISYIFLLPLWWWRDTRFVFPLGFLSCFYLVWLGRGVLKRKFYNLIFVLLMGVNIFDCIGLISWEKRVDIFTNSPQADYFQMLEWIKHHIERSDVLIVAPKPPNVCLITGKLCTEAPYISAPWVIFNFLRSRGVEFVIIDRNFPFDYKNLAPVVKLYYRYFQLVKKIGDCYLYRLSYE